MCRTTSRLLVPAGLHLCTLGCDAADQGYELCWRHLGAPAGYLPSPHPALATDDRQAEPGGWLAPCPGPGHISCDQCQALLEWPWQGSRGELQGPGVKGCCLSPAPSPSSRSEAHVATSPAPGADFSYQACHNHLSRLTQDVNSLIKKRTG